jgi:ABC-2 type transport system ATP-binding protein
MEKVIEVEGLTKSYGKFKAVDDLSLYVEKGRIFGLLGPNGSGKSTTINCILSLLKYQAGEIKIFGETMSPDNYELKSKIGVVFQDVAVFNELSVYDNIDYFCGLYIRDKKTRKKYVEDAIKLTALQDFKKFRPKQLSGGLLRRLNIACGIAHKPKLIFLDEPTVAVDPQSRNAILEGIVKLNKAGATIVYTSHYMEEVEQICDRIVILDKGQIIAKGTKESLKELTTMGERITVEIANLDKKYLEELKEMPDVLDAKYADGKLTLTFARGKEKLPAMIDYLKKNELSYERIFSELPSLNDVFLELTGKELRD